MPHARYLAGLLALFVGLAGPAIAQAQQPERPNIVFAFADDWGAHAGAYGTKGLDTPTFDRVAEDGVLFEHAFVAAPSCTPSRGAVLTGQHIWRLGPGANLHSTLPAALPVYPALLEAAGYFAGHTGKGWGPGTLEPGGRSERPAGTPFDSFDAFLAARPDGAPFVFWFGSSDPHRPFDDSLRQAMRIDPATVTVPPYLPDVPTVRRDIANYYAEVQRFDRDVGALLERIAQAGELDNTIVVISGDHGWPFPRGKSHLYDAGSRVPLAIRWPDEAEAQRTVSDFVSLIDLAPTLLEAAGVEPPAQMQGRSLVGLLRSERAGRVEEHRAHVILAKERHHGLSRPDSAGYPSRAIRTEQFLYIRNVKPERWPAGSPRISSSQWIFSDTDDGAAKRWMIDHADDPLVRPLFLLSFGKRPAEELYDLRTDPHQMHNVAGDPEYAMVRDHLAHTLEQELRALEDPRMIGGAERFDDYPYYVGYGMEAVEPPAPVRRALRLPR
ncbi:MAG: sulfatase-like hydrolase/transferase [Bacteroidetes bacterium]|jgi:arylsulfatase A-like enzyme|nr:sulfatase-like hydrolase/transferase [Bacteroidota bacterium]